MPRIELQTLSDEARIWIFGISPALDDRKRSTLLARIDPFLESWTVHGQPIRCGREIRDNRFLIIAVEKSAETSGCSIDRLFGTMKQLEADLGVSILDADRIFFRHGDGRIDTMTRMEFREKSDPHTVVFDTTAATLGEVRSGRWERPAAAGWHRELFRVASSP